MFLMQPLWAKVTPSLKAIRQPDTALLIQNLGRGKLMVNGKEWDAHKYCNEQSIANPEQIELYTLNERPEIVVLCTGSAKNEENVITVFRQGAWPITRKVRPAKNKNRVSDEVLRNTVIRLTR
jgi:hypothetical protein